MTSGTMELLGVQFERDVIAKLFDGDPSLHMWVRRCSEFVIYSTSLCW